MAGGQPSKVTAVVITAAVIASVVGTISSMSRAVTDHQSVRDEVLSTAVVLAFAAVGAVVAAARPANLVGWVMLAGGTCWALGGAGVHLAYHGLVAAPGSVGGASAVAVAASTVRAFGWSLITLALPVLFPDGRVAGPRWRWLGQLLVLALIGAVVGPLTDPQADLLGFGDWHNPLAPSGPAHLITVVAFLASLPLALVVAAGAVSQLVARWRNGRALQRQQVGLFAAAVALPIMAVPLALLTGAGGLVLGLAALPLPFVIGFTVLARDLYDLRSAANRTLVWLTLSAVVAGVYALVLVGVGGLLHVDQSRAWLTWVAAAAVAVSFAPLRDSLQRGANRLTFGRWDEPYAVLADLGQRLEASTDSNRLLSDVVTELTGLGLADVTVADADGVVLAGSAEPVDGLVEVPLSAYGAAVGTLRYRQPSPPLRPRDRQLLDDLAGHVGGVLHAHQLTIDLQRALEALVLAREEERRRLRRDLHDGLGPSLAGHLLRLDVVAATVGPQSPAAPDLDALRHELRETVEDVRRVVEGLRPPALDELGLGAAIEQAARRLFSGTGVHATVTIHELPPLPAAVEVAAFRIVTEAMTNVARHADATSCEVSVSAATGSLRVRVSDDGRGIAPGQHRTGQGLSTMRERAEELRGSFSVSSCGATRPGTTVGAEVPLLTRPASEPAPTPSGSSG